MTDRKTLYCEWAAAEFYLADTLLKLAARHGEIGLIAERLAGAEGLPAEERYALLREADRAVSLMWRVGDLVTAWKSEVAGYQRYVCEIENGLTREEVKEMATAAGRVWDGSLSHLPSRGGGSDAS